MKLVFGHEDLQIFGLKLNIYMCYFHQLEVVRRGKSRLFFNLVL